MTDRPARLLPLEAREAAFQRVTEARLSRAYRLAGIVLGNGTEAEDAVQEAAERAWQHWDELRDGDRFDAWFDRILVHICRDRMRRRRLAPLTMADPPNRGSADFASDFAVHDALDRALAELDPEQRLVVVLRYIEDLTVPAIAERTGEREGTVKSRLHYARRRLRASVDAANRPGGGA